MIDITEEGAPESFKALGGAEAFAVLSEGKNGEASS